MDITISEMIAALEAAAMQPETADGVTAQDLRKATGWNDKRVNRLLRALKEAGRLGVRKVYRVNLAGFYVPLPAYYLLPAATEPDTENPPGGLTGSQGAGGFD